jgi:hypothetical protein
MAVFRDITITWRGTDYTVTPTLRLMRQIESTGISFTSVAARVSSGEPQISFVAKILEKLLQSGGAKVTEDEVFEELWNGDPEAVQHLVTASLLAFSPGERDPKKPAPHAAS